MLVLLLRLAGPLPGSAASLCCSCNDLWTAPSCLQWVWPSTRPSLPWASLCQVSQTARLSSPLFLPTMLTLAGMDLAAFLRCSSVALTPSHQQGESQGLLAQHKCSVIWLLHIAHPSQERERGGGGGGGGGGQWSPPPCPRSGCRPSWCTRSTHPSFPLHGPTPPL